MSQSAFDDTLWSDWSGSHEGGFEGGWREICAEGGGKADFEALFGQLLRLYREGVVQELAAAIEAFVDFSELQPDAHECETTQPDDFRTEKIGPLVDLWNPFGPGEAAYVKALVESQWPVAFDPAFLEQRRARALLQSLGLLDIDFVREARRPVFRSWGQKPQVVNHDACLVARQCSECRHLIRTFHFYECREGCKDKNGHIDMFKILPKDGGERGTPQYLSPELHWYYANMAFESKQYKVCPACLSKSSHPRSHLRAVRGYTKSGDQVALNFARELDIWEDDLDGRLWENLGVNAFDKLASASKIFSKSSSRHFFPAGNAHCALMFGPLIIENGMTKYPGGALISRRPLVNLTASSTASLREFLSDPSSYRPNRDKAEVLHQKYLSYASNKRLYQADLPVRERRFVTCRKQVSGGLFTNYCDRFAAEEAVIVLAFTTIAEHWKRVKSDQTLTQKEYRAELMECADTISGYIFQTFGDEIQRSLIFFAQRLQKEVKLQYNRLSNNCQDFCNELLLGKDKWDSMFNRIYPPVPANLEQNKDTYCIRYMMSFASRMLHPLDEMPFVDPLASSTQLYDTFGHNDADMIDHVASIRYKMDPEYFGIGMDSTCHDAILLKGDFTTCPSNIACSLADHILDGPHDNLSVLTLHIHRDRGMYTVPSEAHEMYEEFLMERGAGAWIENRLGVLHRLYMLNIALSLISGGFQQFTQGIVLKNMVDTWGPPQTLFGRAWPSNTRQGSTLDKPTWHHEIYGDRSGSSNEGDQARQTQMVLVVMHTHPFMQSDAVWKAQIKTLKERLRSMSRPKGELMTGFWDNCECDICKALVAEANCLRALSYAASQESRGVGQRVYSSSHPDYVPLDRLVASALSLGICKTVVDLLQQMWRTPDYFPGNESESFWRELGVSGKGDIDDLANDESASADTMEVLGLRRNRSISSIVDDYF